MIKLEKTTTFGWEAAIRGMRNPMNSWEKSDSEWVNPNDENPFHEQQTYFYDAYAEPYFEVGPNDLNLMEHLANAGTDHRKFMRMITVYVDITAPLYWWKEFDTYKVGTVANSCSTMHKIHAKEFTLEDFSCEHLFGDSKDILCSTVSTLNFYRNEYISTKDKAYWWQMIQLLPSSYNQKRTVMLNYEVLANIYKSRKNHKLCEWLDFCEWFKTLPYSEMITGVKENHAS